MKISFFKDEWTTYSPEEMMMDLTWDQFADILLNFIEVDVKEKTEMYNLWEFKINDGQIHRCKDDCIALHGLVLDYDKNLSLNDALVQFNSFGFDCVFYTTYNHKPGNDRFRVVLPFSQPLTEEQFRTKRKSMIDSFPGVDRASFSRSQAIFLHSGPNKEHAFSCRLKGNLFDPSIFEDEIIEPVTTISTRSYNTEMTTEVMTKYRNDVLGALSTCSGIRHLNSLSLVIILKSCGGTFADYQQIVKIAGAQDSCIQDYKTQIETWQTISDDCKIGKGKRDKFILEFGGTPINFNNTGEKNKQKYKKINTIVSEIK